MPRDIPRLAGCNLRFTFAFSVPVAGLFHCQRTKAQFPNMIFKTISADHTACRPSAALVKEQCLPSEQGEAPRTGNIEL